MKLKDKRREEYGQRSSYSYLLETRGDLSPFVDGSKECRAAIICCHSLGLQLHHGGRGRDASYGSTQHQQQH